MKKAGSRIREYLVLLNFFYLSQVTALTLQKKAEMYIPCLEQEQECIVK